MQNIKKDMRILGQVENEKKMLCGAGRIKKFCAPENKLQMFLVLERDEIERSLLKGHT